MPEARVTPHLRLSTFNLQLSTRAARASAHVFLHDRDPAADAEGERGDFQAGGGLLALVLVTVALADYVVDDGFVEVLRDEVAPRHAFLDIAFEDGIENIVGRQRVLIALVGPEFGTRRFLDRRCWNDFPLPIDP